MKGRTAALLLFYGLVLLLPAGTAPLVETTEARYGEIAREMLATGNLLEPRFNGILHFHKPPLAYWAMAVGMRLFGENDFGVRFFGVVAAVVAVAFVFRLGRLLLGQERQAQYAAFIFATSLLMLAVSRVASTDIYLTACTAAAQFFLFRQVYGERLRRNALWYGFWLGLGFLTKGPIILLFTVLPFLVAKLFDARHRRVFTPGEVVVASLVFAAVALPWYLLVIAKNPALLEYFWKTQTVERVVTNRFHRNKPFWFFPLIFTGTFLPYCLYLMQGLRRAHLPARPVRLLLIYVAVPLLIFSLAKSKLVTYILPFYGVASLFVAAVYNHSLMPRLRYVVLVITGLLAIATPVTALVVTPLSIDWKLILVATVLPGLALTWQAFRDRSSERFLAWVAANLLLFGTTGYAIFGLVAQKTRGYQQLVARINAVDPMRQEPVVVYRDFIPSVSFYRGALAVMALGDERETQFEKDPGYRDYYLRNAAECDAWLQGTPNLFLVTRPKYVPQITDRFNYTCRELYEQHKSGAYHCQKLAGTGVPEAKPHR